MPAFFYSAFIPHPAAVGSPARFSRRPKHKPPSHDGQNTCHFAKATGGMSAR